MTRRNRGHIEPGEQLLRAQPHNLCFGRVQTKTTCSQRGSGVARGAGRTGRHLPGGSKRRKIVKKIYTHANSDCITVCLQRTKKLSLTRRDQHRRQPNYTLSFTGIARTYPRQIAAIICHVKFDNYKKLGGRIYATPRCVAENFAKLLKIMRN